MGIIKDLGITEGPWKNSPFKIVIDENLTGEICNYNSDDREDSVNTSNGKLIATAPEMLEALIECVETFGGGTENGQTFWLTKIIQKATGKNWEEVKELIK